MLRRLAETVLSAIADAEKDMAGLVSPANSRYREFYPPLGGLDPRPDAVTRIVTVPAVRGNLAFGSPGIVGFICARSLKHERMTPMQLKHLNLTTSDVGGLASFFERFFGFKRLMTRGQDAFALMCNQDQFVLTLMKAKSTTRPPIRRHFMSASTSTPPTPCKPSMMSFRKPACLRERSCSRVEAAAASRPSIATLPAVS